MCIDDVILKLKVIISYLRQGLTRILLGTAMDTNVNGQLETDNKCSRKNFLLTEAAFKSLWPLVQSGTADMCYVFVFKDKNNYFPPSTRSYKNLLRYKNGHKNVL